MSSITISVLALIRAREMLVDDTYCRSRAGRVIAGMYGIHLLAMLAR